MWNPVSGSPEFFRAPAHLMIEFSCSFSSLEMQWNRQNSSTGKKKKKVCTKKSMVILKILLKGRLFNQKSKHKNGADPLNINLR